MKLHIIKLKMAACAVMLLTASCAKLDLAPTNDITADQVFNSPEGYKMALAKVYGAFALTGNAAVNDRDIPSQIVRDEGNSDFLRMYWNLQELTTDESGWSWKGDAGIQGLHELSWSSINPVVGGLYYRSMFQITVCNEFIRQSSDENLSKRGITGAKAEEIKRFRAEARFLRAYQYWVLMDIFGKPAFVTEENEIGGPSPKQISRKELFNYVESELKALETLLAEPKANEYGRADRAAAWALLSRMYLNAEVYTGTPKYTESITYSKKIINSGAYDLHPKYRELFLADNHTATDELILTINYDGTQSQNFGGTTYLMHGPANVPGAVSGSYGSWGGMRATEQFVELFDDETGSTDKRAQFWTQTQKKAMDELYMQTEGYAITKFRNVTKTGGAAPNQDVAGEFADIDFPLFRLGEIYLNYVEAVLRQGSGGDAATALGYINKLRERAYENTSGNITSGMLTLDFILDERGRELHYEALRRTDLIRFNKFTTGTYLWSWKGGVRAGTAVDAKYNIFPLPASDLAANPNLTQNTGY